MGTGSPQWVQMTLPFSYSWGAVVSVGLGGGELDIGGEEEGEGRGEVAYGLENI